MGIRLWENAYFSCFISQVAREKLLMTWNDTVTNISYRDNNKQSVQSQKDKTKLPTNITAIIPENLIRMVEQTAFIISVVCLLARWLGREKGNFSFPHNNMRHSGKLVSSASSLWIFLVFMSGVHVDPNYLSTINDVRLLIFNDIYNYSGL